MRRVAGAGRGGGGGVGGRGGEGGGGEVGGRGGEGRWWQGVRQGRGGTGGRGVRTVHVEGGCLRGGAHASTLFGIPTHIVRPSLALSAAPCNPTATSAPACLGGCLPTPDSFPTQHPNTPPLSAFPRCMVQACTFPKAQSSKPKACLADGQPRLEIDRDPCRQGHGIPRCSSHFSTHRYLSNASTSGAMTIIVTNSGSDSRKLQAKNMMARILASRTFG